MVKPFGKKEHTSNKMDSEKNMCKFCKKCFKTPANLKRHYKIHMGKKSHSCDVCGKSFVQSGNLLIHKRIHTGDKPYQCNVCNEKFSQSAALIRHKRTHTGQKPYVCDQCGKAFTQSDHLVCHKRTHTQSKPYKCLTCGKVFSQSGQLTSHTAIHTNRKKFKCDICGKKYFYKSGLHEHKKTHMDGIFSCAICDKLFLKASNLKKHIENMHPDHKDFDNNAHCGDALTSRRDANHNQKNTAVEKCTLKFDIQVNVVKEPCSVFLHKSAHVINHELPYQCDLCGQRLESSALMDRHKGLHISQRMNEVLSDKLLECCLDIDLEASGSGSHKVEPHETDKEPFCNRSRQTKSDMNHEELDRCNFCAKLFSSSDLLTLHKKCHTGGGVEYDLKNELEMSSPTGITYVCAHCSQEFEVANELIKHYEITHTNSCF